jgi:hypothetical protein
MKIALANDKTKQFLQDWVNKVAALPERHNVEAWLSAAEQSANNRQSEREDIVIEMRGFATASGKPETLTVELCAFDWFDIEGDLA